MANRDFFETEILVAFDQRMMDVDDTEEEEVRDGSEAWREVRRVLRGLGYGMDKADGWGMLGIT
eukprot:2726518-Heterocapsa_arctica.AAC.1